MRGLALKFLSLAQSSSPKEWTGSLNSVLIAKKIAQFINHLSVAVVELESLDF